MSYKVINRTEDHVDVQVGSRAYRVTPSALTLCDLAIAGGGDVAKVFETMAGQIRANSVKEFDAEKAALIAEKAALNAKIEDFKTSLANMAWAKSTLSIASDLQDANEALADLESVPLVLDLSDYEERESGACRAGQYRFAFFTVDDERQLSVVVGLKNAHPLFLARQETDTLKEALAMAVREEIADVIPAGLEDHVKSMKAGLDDKGKIAFDVVMKGRSKTSGNGSGGKSKRVEYKGVVYSTLSELGASINPNARWPHKVAKELVKRGEAKEIES